MPAYNQTVLAPTARNGNSVSILIGDLTVAFAQSVNHGTPFGTEQLYGIGSAKPQETQQLRISPHITVESFDLTPAGVAALANNTNIIYNLANTAFDIHLYDGINNAVILTYVSCTAVDYSQAVPVNQIVRDTISFLALDVLNNQGVSICNLPGAYQTPTLQSAIAAAASASLGLPPANA